MENRLQPAAAGGGSAESLPEAESAIEATGHDDTGFDKEVVGLFALEAHEWLAQIQSALSRLSADKAGPVRSHVYGIVLNGITNLAKSAATVHLDEIEMMATNLLPTLRDVGGGETAVAAESLRHLHQGLDRVIAAVRQLAAVPTRSAGEAEGLYFVPAFTGLGATGLQKLHRVALRKPQNASQGLELPRQRRALGLVDLGCEFEQGGHRHRRVEIIVHRGGEAGGGVRHHAGHGRHVAQGGIQTFERPVRPHKPNDSHT